LDRIGHNYGPDSHEVMDSILRLDRTLADFLKFLDEKVGRGRYLVVLTADHGVAPLPERIQAMTGRELSAGRVRGADLDAQVFPVLDAKYGAPANGERWAARDGLAWHLNPAVLAEKRLAAADVAATLREALLQVPVVAMAFTRAQLTGAPPLDAAGEAMRLSYHPARSADVLVVLKPYYIDRINPGTTHGSPYSYDSHVPLLWFGTGVKPGVHTERVGVDDLAPTLAHLLGVTAPAQATGRVLF
jgi:arylsulfatase A-like enzyme